MAKIYSKQLKQKARDLRNLGLSIGEISLKMHISKNTLSGWLKDIELTEKQKDRIRQKIIDSGVIGRPLAVKAAHQKIERWKEGIYEKIKYFKKLPIQNPVIGKLICGVLYLCEGAKYPSSRYLYIGNSDPKVISFFLSSLRKYYKIIENKLRFSIHYRCDQDYEVLKDYWSKVTNIPKAKCLKSKPDLRTRGKPTLRKDYKGVCRVIYYDVSLQFELQSIGESIIEKE